MGDTEGAEGAERRGWGSQAREELNLLTDAVIGAAIEVHRVLGPGFLESFYEQALCMELAERAIPFARQAGVTVFYKGIPLGEARLDLVVDERLLVELKATSGHAPIHFAQVLSYLKATGLSLALLINFNAPSLRQGLKRIIRTPSPTPSTPPPSARSAPSASSPILAPSDAPARSQGPGVR